MKILIILIFVLLFLFCLSGFFMASSFGASSLADKDRYELLIKIYLGGAIISLIALFYTILKK